MDGAPALEIPTEIRAAIEAHGADRLAAVEAFLDRAPRPCIAVTSERVSAEPLHRGLLGRLASRPIAEPKLGALASKFGGRPYRERGDGHAIDGLRFVCQINLADVPTVAGAPSKGLLALDIDWSSGDYRHRWYPSPALALADEDADVPSSLGKWETQMRFAPSWSLPGGDAWHEPLPADEALWDLWNDWEPAGFVDSCDAHVLFGHRASGLDDHYGFEASAGASTEITDYEQVFRLTHDNQADFGLGTNWFHLMTPAKDYQHGDLSRSIVVGANY